MPAISTFRDLVDQLLDLYGTDPTARNLRAAKTAVQYAYRELPAVTRWTCFQRYALLRTSAPYSTGTIAYDHTGGTYERMVTLTTGTWPDWAADGQLVLSGTTRYNVAQRVSSTVLILEETSNPGADVAAATAYSLERSSYELPSDFRKLLKCYNNTSQMEIPLTSLEAIRQIWSVNQRTAGQPRLCTATGTGDAFGSTYLMLGPTPDAAYDLEIFYEAGPRPLWTEYEAQGTVSVSAAGTTVTGSGTAFAASHVGSLLRLSQSTTVEPTNEIGSCVTGKLQPYTVQRRVLRVTSATVLVVDEAIDTAHTSVKFCLSDPIDIEPQAMATAMQRLAEAEMARRLTMKDAPERELMAKYAIRGAMEADSRQPPSGALGALAFAPTIEAVT